MSSEMFFAFPHHLSQIIEEEERQSSRTSVSVDKESDELVEEISHQEEAGGGDEDSEIPLELKRISIRICSAVPQSSFL